MQIRQDLSLIEAASEGDTEAIEQVLLQYQPSITRFARKYCATPEDVEDAVQETLWVIYKKINSLQSSAAFVSWVFTIVRNHCYRLLTFKYHNDDGDISLSKLDYVDYVGEEAELALMLKQDVIRAIAQIPFTYRQVLLLRDVEGMTAPEVAERLGITIAAVKSRLHQGRSLLREFLKAWSE
jgi:RNA polymerase sigma factor (sigma-70 family)